MFRVSSLITRLMSLEGKCENSLLIRTQFSFAAAKISQWHQPILLKNNFVLSCTHVHEVLRFSPSLQQPGVRHAGHAKWQNIKHTKMSKDQEKQVLRGKLSYSIRTAIREGGSADPKLNKLLANVIEIARNNQVPMENIQKILTDSKDKNKELKLIPFALKGPAQVVIIIETETENSNRTRQELSAFVKKKQFTIGDVSTGLYQFKHKGVILCSEYKGNTIGEEQLDEAEAHAIECGAEDVSIRNSYFEYGNVLEFTTDPSPSSFYPVVNALEKLNYKIVYSELEYIPLSTVELSDAYLEAVSDICEKLSSHKDVVKLFDNIIFPEQEC